MTLERDSQGGLAAETASEPVHAAAATPAASPPPDGSPREVRRVVVFVTVALALMMMAVDSTIVATALHALQHGLGTSINWASWTITAYSLGFVLMLPMSGKLSSTIGRRRVFVWSVVVFTAASLCCGLVDNIFLLIALRAVQAAGGAGFTPSATGIVVDHFGDQRDRAVGLFGSIFPIGGMIGPIFGGLFVTYWSWRGVFFVNVPIGLLLIWLCFKYVPRDRARQAGARGLMDLTGMGLLGLGVLGGMLGVAYMGERHATLGSAMFLVPVVIGIVAVVMFVRHVGRAVVPFIAPRLIYGRNFGTVNLINAIFGGITLGVIALIPLYAANRYGIDPLRAGTLLVAEGIAAITLSVFGAVALRRTGYRWPLYGGSVVIALGLVLLALHPVGMSPYAWLVLATFALGVGAGAINPASRNAGLQLAPDDASTIAALRSMCLQIGSISVVSIASAVIAQSHAPGGTQAWVDVVLAFVIVISIPLIAWVPEHHGAW